MSSYAGILFIESKKTAEISLNEVTHDSKKAHYYFENPADIARFYEDHAQMNQYPRPLGYASLWRVHYTRPLEPTGGKKYQVPHILPRASRAGLTN